MQRKRSIQRSIASAAVALALLSVGCGSAGVSASAEPSLLTFSRIDKAWKLSRGDDTIVAVLDWSFDIRGGAAEKYVDPVSLVPGEEVGDMKPWHGEWMAEIVHAVAPGAKILPIRARSLESRTYEEYLVQGIRVAADHGAVAVTSSMGPLRHDAALIEAIDYAERRGTIFVDVHPEYVVGDDGTKRSCTVGECPEEIIHSGVVSVPDHPARPEPSRDIYVWPYDLEAVYEDGWGYSNGPPVVGGVIALIKSANPDLSPTQVRRIISETAEMKDGFKVLNAEAAVRAAGDKG